MHLLSHLAQEFGLLGAEYGQGRFRGKTKKTCRNVKAFWLLWTQTY
jgi:hypothetical protein